MNNYAEIIGLTKGRRKMTSAQGDINRKLRIFRQAENTIRLSRRTLPECAYWMRYQGVTVCEYGFTSECLANKHSGA